MKILSNNQIRQADAFTIENEPISSIDLMERAAVQLYREWISRYAVEKPVEIFAGPGNNGGDGIALARMLADKGYQIKLYILKTDHGFFPDAKINFERLPASSSLTISWLELGVELPVPEDEAIIVDALFGSGLSRSLDGFPELLVNHINTFQNIKVAIDIPSGLFAENNAITKNRAIFRADYTWCFQFPKLGFLMPENETYVGEWEFFDIGLHPGFISSISTPYYYVTEKCIKDKIIRRRCFSHKGDFGHAMLMAGSTGKFGAAILAGKACLRSGVGLLTIHLPSKGMMPVHSALPETMLSLDENEDFIGSIPDLEPFSAIGIGPGMGTRDESTLALGRIISRGGSLILDADALNILSENNDLLDKLPPGTILTPHPGEYIRLFGPDPDHYTRVIRMREIAKQRDLIIVLKGAYTCIASPDGNLRFDSTGNPGMATAGSGDVLSGIILSLLAQGYSSLDAAVIAVYLHGLAGDIGEQKLGQEGLIAGDIIDYLPRAFVKCKSE